MSGWAGSAHDRHCEHGTPIGDPFGPDYLCGFCEDGTSWTEFLLIQQSKARAQLIDAAGRKEGVIFRKILDVFLAAPGVRYNAAAATALVNHWWDDLDRLQAECDAYDNLVEFYGVAA